MLAEQKNGASNRTHYARATDYLESTGVGRKRDGPTRMQMPWAADTFLMEIQTLRL